MKDYYVILGVNSEASAKDIKKAFKELAKRHHPDANKGNSKAEEKFKEISEAYDVLGNPESRRDYDQQRFAQNSFGYNSEGTSFNGHGFSGNAEEILRNFAQARRKYQTPFDDINFSSSFGGFSNLFENERSNDPSIATLKVPLKTACAGGQIQVSGLPDGTQTVNIPANSKNGSEIQISTSRGPFILRLVIEDEPPFYMRGNEVETTISINIAQAILGSQVKMRAPRGEDLIVRIPPGTQPLDVLRLKGQGIGGGDLFVKLEIQMPKNLSENEKQILIEFAKTAGLKY